MSKGLIEMSKQDLRKICVNAFEKGFGVKPKLNDIVLLECQGDGISIMFSIAGNPKVYGYTKKLIEEQLSVYDERCIELFMQIKWN